MREETVQNSQNHQETFSPKDLAAALGVSESSIKRWVDGGRIEALRTPGGHRRIAIGEALRFVRSTGAPLVRPELVGLTELRGREPARTRGADLAATGDALYEALLAGKALEARALAVASFIGGARIVELCDGPLRQAMARLGELWHHDSAGVFLEHRATAAVVEILGRLRSLVHVPEGAPRAVGGAPSADPYQIPTLAAAAVLTEEGFDAVNLGPETPLHSFELAIDQLAPRLVWVSVSTEASGAAVERGLDSLASHAKRAGVSLVIGGRALEGRVLGLEHGAVHCRSLGEMAAFARGLRLRAGN